MHITVYRLYVAPTYFSKGGYPVTLLPPPRRPESWPGDYMGKATPVCRAVVIIPPLPPNVTNSRAQATANTVGGKACSSTKGGLLRYILNTYSIHKVSSLNLHITSTQYAAYALRQRIFPREAIPSHYDTRLYITLYKVQKCVVFLFCPFLWCCLYPLIQISALKCICVCEHAVFLSKCFCFVCSSSQGLGRFKACFWPKILLKNKFWNLGEKTIPQNSYMSCLLKTRTSTSFILQALP